MKHLSGFFLIIFGYLCGVVLSADNTTLKVSINECLKPENDVFFINTVWTNGDAHTVTAKITEIKGIKVLTLEGSYQFTDSDGISQYYEYIANEKGYTITRPDGETVDLNAAAGILDKNRVGALFG